MEHKAFLFNYEQFEHELLPKLRDALTSTDCSELISFIKFNLATLSDPYEGEQLTPDWESLLETKDVHQYGDFALTKYYDPADDIGLGTIWQQIQELMPLSRSSSPILGITVGTADDPFDPGKMGSYFQSKSQVQDSLDHLCQLAQKHSSEELNEAIDLLQTASRQQLGLYVTF
ncbi:hypothetical protein [Calycomorphotria hydatis]|uniref:Uncharacterized protein n=1 Tax=Calycomorphotria hydatis TaxID=2528027 RepID=A0A517TCC4_9PLAN|nr:hypothetical protein [Calycomorphotria hydatis]QDT66000.1 hypothetical protein V22_32640 [Calycomorphotria hydatis]